MTIGGGFGGKFMLVEALAAAVAVKVGRSVRLEYTRMDDFLAANPAPPSIWEVKLGAKKDGTITAMQAKVIFDTGAYAGSPVSIGSLLLGSSYNYAAIDIRGYEVLTNKTPAGAYRGPGAVQAGVRQRVHRGHAGREARHGPVRAADEERRRRGHPPPEQRARGRRSA